MSPSPSALSLVPIFILIACGGGDAGTRDTAASPPAGAGAPETTAAPTPAASDTAAPAPAAARPAPVKKSRGKPTPQMVALGDSIFHGRVAGGTCTACHGQGG
jgi:hypothetical protein